MPLTKPASNDPGYSGATKASTVIGGIVDAINQRGIDVKSYAGAAGDGSTDDSAAFATAETAAGNNGTIFVPAGTYIVNNWTPTHSGLTVIGVGMPGSILKAKASAAAAATVSQLARTTWHGITFDGNSAASHGLDITGATNASSFHTFRDCTFQNASIGCAVLNGSPTNEADQNEFDHCYFNTNTTGFSNVATNGQQTVFNNVRIGGTNTTGIILGGSASLLWNSGQCVNYTTGISFSGTNGNGTYVEMHDVGFQSNTAGATDIDGSAHWPQLGVQMYGCILLAGMSAGSGKTVSMKASAVLQAYHCAFEYGDLTANFSGCFVEDYNCQFSNSGTYTGAAGTSKRISLSDANGSGTSTLKWFKGSAVVLEVDFANGVIVVPQFSTAGRPSASTVGAGAMYLDTTLHKPGWFDGTNWKDATGTNI